MNNLRCPVCDEEMKVWREWMENESRPSCEVHGTLRCSCGVVYDMDEELQALLPGWSIPGIPELVDDAVIEKARKWVEENGSECSLLTAVSTNWQTSLIQHFHELSQNNKTEGK